MINYFVSKIKFRKNYKEWKKRNSHNHTEIQRCVPIEQIVIGKETYGMINVRLYSNKKNYLRIGSFCSISENTYFVYGEHDYKRFSTFPFKYIMLNEREDELSKGDIVLEDDVWVGFNSIILSGVTIGQGAVIGAGSIVAKDIPPYAIYAGGKIIGYRFKQEIIDKLLEIDFNKVTRQYIQDNQELIYDKNIETFLESSSYQMICK